jgi:hypothetical protein
MIVDGSEINNGTELAVNCCNTLPANADYVLIIGANLRHAEFPVNLFYNMWYVQLKRIPEHPGTGFKGHHIPDQVPRKYIVRGYGKAFEGPADNMSLDGL